MSTSTRSAQIWPLLALAACNRQVLTYEQVARLVGLFQAGLGKYLEPIQSYCILNALPPLSSLVVSAVSGLPGEGFIAAPDVPQAQARVFAHDWLSSKPPTSEQLEAAVLKLPSNGRPLVELSSQATQAGI